ncbi:DNA primase family protein [Limimaricola cinnabarinus]|uniref:DNA primase/helicase, phage-associated n=1 Tax=Limimaricola cinnabarinus LL-001 TaxID=1337093 RepID=U3AL57_9RHOB|nr:DNA primase family protein [Limimaricola cinnabarinus]GAD55478.1 DNA primase/helicase, phage-associated [Limimaricola cinnabarinus LL-001]
MTDEIDPLREVRDRFASAEEVDMGDVPIAAETPDPEDDSVDAQDREAGPSNDRSDPTTPPPLEVKGAGFPLNDVGNGRRFVLYHGSEVTEVKRVGWFVWDDTRWAQDDNGIGVRRLAQSVSDRMLHEIRFLALDDWERERLAALPSAEAEVRRLRAIEEPTDEDETALKAAYEKVNAAIAVKKALAKRRTEHRTFAKSTGNTGKIDAMLTEAGVTLSKTLDQLDADPLAINTASGTLHFSVHEEKGKPKRASWEMRPHDREDYLTKCMPVEHDPEATAPLFEGFLRRVQPDPQIRGFLQRWFALSMTGVVVQNLVFFYGHGANGKSVLVDLMARMMGDYSATAKIESLTGQSKRGGADATPDLVPLMGARMVRASEPEQGERLKEGTIKELTGGEPILVRALREDFIEVHPKFKLTISGNHKPEIRGTDDGIWRRVLLVLFGVQIPEEERDPHLGKKLWEERAGILNWLIEGLEDYLELGLQVPESVAEATRAYREESDPVGSFLDQSCEVTGDAEAFTRTKDLVTAFNYWMDERGDSQWTPRTVQLRLKSKADHYRDRRSGLTFTEGKRSVAGYRGLLLSEEFKQRMADASGQSGSYGNSPPASSSGSPSDWAPDPYS